MRFPSHDGPFRGRVSAIIRGWPTRSTSIGSSALPRLSGLRLSPDGTRLAVVVARPSADGKKMVSAIWQLDAEGVRAPVRLTRSVPGESAAEFLPDGSLLFVSARPDPDARPDGNGKDGKDGADPPAALWLLPAGGR